MKPITTSFVFWLILRPRYRQSPLGWPPPRGWAKRREEYYDSYGKYFLFGGSKAPIPSHVRIFNKVGEAYGYLIDDAYIVDFDAGVEFLLTAVILVNADQVLNDDKYEYEEIGLPFLARLGRAVYEHELRRERPRRPDLTRFRVR